MPNMESQFQDLSKRLGGHKETYIWVERALVYENLAISELRRAGFDHLATSHGLNYIKGKFSCPNTLRKDH